MEIAARPLTKEAFAPYGQVMQKSDAQCFKINNGRCIRYNDLARVETDGPGARALVNIFSSEPYGLPLEVSMVERHPLGSQAFFPLSKNPFIVVVCRDSGGTPTDPAAFLATEGQGVNIGKNVWHGVLTPLHENSDFLVIDRGGEGKNLEECFLESPFTVVVEDTAQR